MINRVRLQTPAKVNPILEVISKRPDGYHELSLVFQAVSLFDELEFIRGGDGLRFEMGESPSPLPLDDSNLVVKAAKLFLKDVLQGEADVLIRLTKKIPLAAGLGGGSSDAAATLTGLNLVFNAMASQSHLNSLAAQLGSDVPFFLAGGTALGSGRGEVITPWEPAPRMHLVLVNPPEGLSTPAVYQSGKAVFSPGEKAKAFKGLLREKNLPKIAGSLFNSLQPAALHLMPEIGEIQKSLLEAGALGTLVSGSGPTVFGVAENRKAAERIAAQLAGDGRAVFAVETIGTGVQILEQK